MIYKHIKFQFVELNTERVALLRDPLSFLALSHF